MKTISSVKAQRSPSSQNAVPFSPSTSVALQELDHQIKSFGEDILKSTENVKTKTFFNKDYWYAKIMDWSMKNENFKVQMFRFVDVLPALNSSQEISKHIKEYFKDIKSENGVDAASLFNVGVGVGNLAPGLMAKAIKKNIEMMAKMFITGKSPEDALKILKQSRKSNLAFTADLLGEATLSEEEAIAYQKRYIELLNTLVYEAKKWEENSIIDSDALGPIPKVNISVKLTSLYSQINEKAWQHSIDELLLRLQPIVDLAIENNVFINIDMESYKHKDLTIEVFKNLVLKEKYKNYPHFGVVIQAYLRDSYSDLTDLIAFAKKRETPFSIRLVKGAYWDYETIHSQQNGWENPVYTNKQESDANYERCAQLLLDAFPYIKVALASHNVRSLSASICYAEKIGLSKNAFELQMLYGMAEPIKQAFIQKGFRVREYATIGDLLPGMAYLVRRLLENTSNESFLKSKFADNISTDILLKNPALDLQQSQGEYIKHPGFDNEPPLDFALNHNRVQVQEALTKLKTQLPLEAHVLINGEAQNTTDILTSENPCDKSSLGKVHLANEEHVEAATLAAQQGQKKWAQLSMDERAKYLDNLGHEIKAQRFDLIALIVLEAGKGWVEADNEVIEAIDFCHFYAHEARKLGTPKKVGHIPGESSHYNYSPRGVSAVIAPWNFPFAILTGMTTASLVTGNTAILKPAEQTSLIGSALMSLIKKAGFPSDVVQFLPGRGEIVGARLTSHPMVDIIAFTGSREVGLKIYEQSAKIHPQQVNVKKCVIEMGGKNALIIDNDADLDEAVSGVVYSAFGFQGQKCSACSRAIVLEEVYEAFVNRLTEATKSIKVLPAENPESYLAAVIDKEAFDNIQGFIQRAKSTSTLAYQGDVSTEGYFISPTLFIDTPPDSELAQSEVFGPVLAVIKAKNIEDAIQMANSTPFALTGGVYSRSPGNIQLVKEKMEVGNLYINRTITGAVVQRHPFGGYKMSGIGSKAGSTDYLLQFLNPKVVTENLMRRGFAPTE